MTGQRIDGREVLWEPTARQTVALTSMVEDLMYGGARGGGKSAFLLIDWLSQAEQEGPANGLLVRRTMPELDEIVAASLALFPRLGLRWSAQDKTWHHPNGSLLRLRYLETVADASRYQGHEYQWVGIDEAGNYPLPNVVDLLWGCLRTTVPGQPCRMRLTANPGGPGHAWLKARYVEPAPPEQAHQDPDSKAWRVYIPAKLEDNQHVADKDAYRRRLSRAGAPHLVRAWLHGDWGVLPNGGRLKPELIAHGTPPPKEQLKVYIGIDPNGRKKDNIQGKTDPWALVVAGVDSRRNVWLLDCVCEVGTSLELWNELKSACRTWDPVNVWIEGGPVGNAVSSIFEELQQRDKLWYPIQYVSHVAEGDKIAKSQAFATAIELGVVRADRHATWWPEYRDECTVFDGSDDRHDDRVDASSIIFRELRRMMEGEDARPAAAALPARHPRTLGLPTPQEAVKRAKSKGAGDGAGLAHRSAFRRP